MHILIQIRDGIKKKICLTICTSLNELFLRSNNLSNMRNQIRPTYFSSKSSKRFAKRILFTSSWFVQYARFLGENVCCTTAYYNHFWQCSVNVGVHSRIGHRKTSLGRLVRDVSSRIIEDDLPRSAMREYQCMFMRSATTSWFYKTILRT